MLATHPTDNTLHTLLEATATLAVNNYMEVVVAQSPPHPNGKNINTIIPRLDPAFYSVQCTAVDILVEAV